MRQPNNSVNTQLKDHFLDANDYDNLEPICVFVDDLTSYYCEEAAIGENHNTINGPFKDKTPQECYALLRQLQRSNESELDWSSFVILDDRSLRDDTCILVCDGDEAGNIQTVRSAFDVVSTTLALLVIGEIAFDECLEEARVAKDGIWRFRHTNTFPKALEQSRDWVREGFVLDERTLEWKEVGREGGVADEGAT